MVSRFAPSLTGYLHLGHVLHMLYVWGIARAKGGRVISRIEDHDLSRRRPEYESAILETMAWLGFVPDEGIMPAAQWIRSFGGTTSVSSSGRGMARPATEERSDYRQSDCDDQYERMLQRLNAHGLVYGCECTRKQIIDEQSDEAAELCYTGTCSDKGLPLVGNTVRFRVPADEVAFEDLRLGACRQIPRQQCGDFSLRDRQGQWTYQFACVCDDIRHGVDWVIRGEDILASTARQILLFQALDAPVPTYFHHPLICDESGEKLSKRQRSESISQLRDAGIPAEEIIGRAVFAAGFMRVPAPLSLDDALTLVTEKK
ncbi:MAG TPA: glutamate--tRNA ligase family protein [Pontiella sp.]|nr:glutamate--tRNA ligase family protein [Pontiella sp.]